MKWSWGFLIAKQYNYQFENFYATVIQRAYRNYKKRPKSLTKRVWETVRNDGTPDNKKFLDIVPCGKTYYFINEKLIESNYVSDQFYVENKHNIYFATTWTYEKRFQLIYRLATVTHILVRKLLYKQGYMVVRGTYWLNILKWPRDPKYYSIHRKYNYRYLIRISEYETYKSKSSGMEKPICDSPLKYRYRINGKDITVNFSDLDDNCEFVRQIFQISP